MNSIIDVKNLIKNYYLNNPDGHFFDKETLKYYGERLSDMRVLDKTKEFQGHKCYVLKTIQRNNLNNATKKYFYFDVDTYKYILE